MLREQILPQQPVSLLPSEREEASSSQEDWQASRSGILDGYQQFLSSRNMDGEGERSEGQELELPVALRRAKRRCSTSVPDDTILVRGRDDADGAHTTTTATPSRSRRSKRVRFSDPGQTTVGIATPSRRAVSGTSGLTPSFRETILSEPRRRRSAPAGTPHPFAVTDAFDPIEFGSIQTIQFTPHRQLLDERCKRRIRRNGLSEETNSYEADKREMEKLRKEIEAKDEELRQLKKALDKQNATEVDRTRGVSQVEEELRVLRRSMEESTRKVGSMVLVPDSMSDMRQPSADHHDGGDSIHIFEDNDDDDDTRTEPFNSDSPYRSALIRPIETRDASASADLPDLRQDAEMLTMALDLEVAGREKREMFKEWRKHFPSSTADRATTSGFEFQDTPSRGASASNSFSRPPPSLPSNFMQQLSSKLKSTTTRAEDAELALCALETELRTLGFVGKDGLDIVTEIRTQFRSARLEVERVLPGQATFGFDGNRKLLPEMLKRMKQLYKQVRDREAELRSLNDQQRALKGNFDHACISIETATKKIGELEDTIDANAEELLDMRMRLQEVEHGEAEKDKTIQSLIQALDKYRNDVARLEQLITTMEAEEPFKIQAAQEESRTAIDTMTGDLREKLHDEEQTRHKAEKLADERLRQLSQLQTSFEDAANHAMEMEVQMNSLRASKEEDDFRSKRVTLEKDEQYQAHLGCLNAKISNLSTAVEEANAEVAKLRAAKERVETRLKAEIEQGQRAVEAVQQDLAHDFVRSLAKVNDKRKSYIRGTKIRYANSEIEEEDLERDSSPSSSSAPLTPVSVVRFADVEMDRGKHRVRRRRYDSGVGLLSEAEEDDSEQELAASDAEVRIVESVEDDNHYD